MMRTLAGRVVCVSAAALVAAGPTAAGQMSVTTQARCAADLGLGEQTRRRFCDVLIAARAADSVQMALPAYDGPATLMMDLHNRFTVPPDAAAPADAFERQAAVVAVVGADGRVLGRASVTREFRTIQDLFDRIRGGTRPGGVKGVAPGEAEAVRLALPTGLEAIGVVGVRLQVLSRTVDDTFEAPGRPVAIVSNLRIEYRPK